MDHANLQTASTYLNNLLLARGLLRNGKAVDFARLAIATSDGAGNADEADKGGKADEGRKNVMAAEIINLVHDLILRRDRDQSHIESLSMTLSSLRHDTTSLNGTLSRVQTEAQTLKRSLYDSQTEARAAQRAAAQAEVAAKALREELQKCKTMLKDVRASASKDVSRRDLELKRLRGHLSSAQRGTNAPGRPGATSAAGSMTAPTCSITGGADTGWREDQQPTLQDAEYSLKQETTEFLTQLSQSLSDENDSLIGLIRSTVSTLRDLQGLPSEQVAPSPNQDAGKDTETIPNYLLETGGASQPAEPLVTTLASSPAQLSTQLSAVLNPLHELLTNPSFAPIEEVQIRDEEIGRLREGWEKMESTWREAVIMMQGWRKRMMAGGDGINLEDVGKGLQLGVGLESPLQPGKKIISIQDPYLAEGNTGENGEGNSDGFFGDLPQDESSLVVDESPVAALKEAMNNIDLDVIRPRGDFVADSDAENKENARSSPSVLSSNVVTTTMAKVNFNDSEHAKPGDKLKSSAHPPSTAPTTTRQKTSNAAAMSKPSHAQYSSQPRKNSSIGQPNKPKSTPMPAKEPTPLPSERVRKPSGTPSASMASGGKARVPSANSGPDNKKTTQTHSRTARSLPRKPTLHKHKAESRENPLSVKQKLELAETEAREARARGSDNDVMNESGSEDELGIGRDALQIEAVKDLNEEIVADNHEETPAGENLENLEQTKQPDNAFKDVHRRVVSTTGTSDSNAAVAKKRAIPQSTGRGTSSGKGPNAEVDKGTMKTKRRRKKSTLTPEELEKLMLGE